MPAADLADVEAVVRTIATVAVDNEKYFGDLDAVVGDGDFGYSMARGKSDVGDKTLLDALVPAVDTIEEQLSAGHDSAAIVRAAAATAREHAEATRPMQAMRGRASYTGERSIGTLDAGAVAVAVMFEALADQRSERSAQS